MAIIRAIYRSIVGKFPTQSQLRVLSTAPRTTKETPAVKQPSRRSLLYQKVATEHSSSRVADILNKWVNQGYKVKKFDIMDLYGFFRRQKKFDAALQLFDWMETHNLEINNAHHAIRIDLLYKSRGIASAEEYFNSLPASEKTSKTYGALLGSYCKGSAFDKAPDLFHEMKELNLVSTLNYNNMLLLYYRTGQPEKVVHLVREMEEKNIALDQYSYNTLINIHAALKDFDAVEGVLEKMKINNFEQDAFTCGNLATIYFTSGSHDKAKAYLEKMEKFENQNSNELLVAGGTRLKLYSEMNDLSGVNRAWESLNSGLPTLTNTKYLLMFLALSKLGELERLETLFKEWEDQCKTFDFRLSNVLLNYYLSRDMIEKAASLYERLVDKRKGHNLRALDLYSNLCIRKGDIDLALDYLDQGFGKAKPEHRKWFPTYETIELFVKYFEENNNEDSAEKRFVESMKKVSREIPDSLLSKIKVSGE